MTEFEKVLMERDGLTEAEAKEERKRARAEFYEALEDYDDVEEMLMCDYGLEMDYIFDLI